MKVQVSVDNVSYEGKPLGYEMPTIKRRTVSLWQAIELEELADLNGNKGHVHWRISGVRCMEIVSLWRNATLL